MVFGRRELPEGCLIIAGAYLPSRKEWIRRLFDEWERLRGQWVKYSYVHKKGKEYLLLFNVYGASMLLEVLQLIKEGGAKKVFFMGSLGGKDLPVGTLVLPSRIIDKTGLISVDTPQKLDTEPDESSVRRLKEVLANRRETFVEGEIASVPCVLHGIEHISDFVERQQRILGVECETSTLFHFSRKESLEAYALLYISDNKKHDIISSSESLLSARRRALTAITLVAVEVLE